MNAGQWERITEHLQRLRLFKSRERLEALLQEASTQEWSYADFLDAVPSRRGGLEDRQEHRHAH